MKKLVALSCAILSLAIAAPQARAQAGTEEEKIYVQLDKPYYMPGDAIWMNITALEARTHQVTPNSDVVYAELIDPSGREVASRRLQLEKGTARADFQLPDVGGLYTVRAYTNWSRNFEGLPLMERKVPVQHSLTSRLLLTPDFDKENYAPGDSVTFELDVRDLDGKPASSASVAYKVYVDGQEGFAGEGEADREGHAALRFALPEGLASSDVLINAVVSHAGTEESIARAVPVLIGGVELSFYPEGGHPGFVVPWRIAFEGRDAQGAPADLSGKVLDDLGREVATFESFHMGMGVITLKYEPGRSYAALLDGYGDQRFPLPQAKASPSLALASRSDSALEWRVCHAEPSMSLKASIWRRISSRRGRT